VCEKQFVMKNSPDTTARVASVLSISPVEEDHFVLRDMLNLLDGSLDPHRTFLMKSCANLSTALSVLRDRQFEVVVCERDLTPGSWKDVLEEVTILPDPPSYRHLPTCRRTPVGRGPESGCLRCAGKAV